MFTPEAEKYLAENYKRYTSSQLAKQLHEKFGISPALQTVTWKLNLMGIVRGDGYRAENYDNGCSKPIGSERVEKGAVYIKIDENRWIPKTQYVTGCNPKTEQVIFIDGNSLNVTPKNIIVVSKRIHVRLAKNGWLNSSEDVLKAGIKWSELLYAIKEVEG